VSGCERWREQQGAEQQGTELHGRPSEKRACHRPAAVFEVGKKRLHPSQGGAAKLQSAGYW